MHLLGELESSTRSAHKRIDEIKDIVESINQLTVAIKSQQNSIENMAKRLVVRKFLKNLYISWKAINKSFE